MDYPVRELSLPVNWTAPWRRFSHNHAMPLTAIEEEQVADLGGCNPVALNSDSDFEKLRNDIRHGLYSHG